RSLIHHLQKEYDTRGRKLFEDQNAFYALRRILLDMLNDSNLPTVFLMIDALDECDVGLDQLLDLMTLDISRPQSKAKWLVASRYAPDIEKHLKSDDLRQKISLELNSAH